MLLVLLFAVSAAVSHCSSVVIVGGGPAGMACAMSLTKHSPSSTVTVLEASEDPSAFNPSRSFLYLIDGRGQDFTDEYVTSETGPNVLSDVAVSSKEFRLSILETDFAKPAVSLPFVDTNRRLPYWVQRAHFVKLLSDAVPSSVIFKRGVQCKSVKYDEVSDKYIVEAADESGKVMKLPADLVVGADGWKSTIRTTAFSKKNKVVVRKSPAGVLGFKALQVKTNFAAYNSTFSTTPSMAYSIRSATSGYADRLNLGLLPIVDASVSEKLGLPKFDTRSANIVTRDDHVTAKFRDAAEAREFFIRAFPQLHFDKEGVVDESEWERFVNAKPVRFPHPQRASRLTEVSPSGKSGVILLGDAAHAFPPDIGQGVNSALVDVCVLQKCFKSSSSLSDVLNRYEKERMPEVKSLVRLCQIGNPYQYRQTGTIATLRRMLWNLNFVFRLLLFKASRGLLSANAFFSMQSEPSYSKILRRCDAVTWLMRASGTGLFLLLFRKKLPPLPAF